MIISSWLLCLSYLEMELEYKSYTLWNRVRCVYVILQCYWG